MILSSARAILQNATMQSSRSCGIALTPPGFQSPLSFHSAVSPVLWGCRPWADALRPWMFPPLLGFTQCFAQIHVEGRENIEDLPGPVLFASNHQSHLDTYVILAALPERHRYRTAPSIRDEVFAGSTRVLRLVNRLRYYFTVIHLNGFTLPPVKRPIFRPFKNIQKPDIQGRPSSRCLMGFRRDVVAVKPERSGPEGLA
jgi:hypothetical protein